MLTIPETVNAQTVAAEHKAHSLETPGRLLLSGMLAGAFMGIGAVLMVSTAGPMFAVGEGLAKLVSGLVFGTALTLTVFAGAELATSAMMALPLGVLTKKLKPGKASLTLLFILIANLAGAALFALLIRASGVLVSNKAAGQMLSDMLASKAHETPLELFARGILCNILVCLAIWMGSRVNSDGTKTALIFIAITAFISSGYEHVIANMFTYSYGIVSGDPNGTFALFGKNLLWVGLGNLVGGAIVVALTYWVIAGRPTDAAPEIRA